MATTEDKNHFCLPLLKRLFAFHSSSHLTLVQKTNYISVFPRSHTQQSMQTKASIFDYWWHHILEWISLGGDFSSARCRLSVIFANRQAGFGAPGLLEAFVCSNYTTQLLSPTKTWQSSLHPPIHRLIHPHLPGCVPDSPQKSSPYSEPYLHPLLVEGLCCAGMMNHPPPVPPMQGMVDHPPAP